MSEKRIFVDTGDLYFTVPSSIIFVMMSLFVFYTGLGHLAFGVSFGAVFMIVFGIIINFCSNFLLTTSFCSKKIKVIVFSLVMLPLLVFATQTNEIKMGAIDNAYTKIDDKLINSYSGIVETAMYKNFLVDKGNRDLKALRLYKNNINNYLSISSEQAMNLKLFYTSVTNKEMRAKLDEIFKDKLVTKSEFVNFQKFVYNLDLTPQEVSMLALVSK
jgi:hypothetical protein